MSQSISPLVLRFGDRESMSKAGAALVAAEAAEAIRMRGVFTLALSGGSTPKRMFELLAGHGGVEWGLVHVFWVDERCVPPDADGSNYRLAREALLDRVPIPVGNIHRMAGEHRPCAEAAGEYEAGLRQTFARLDHTKGFEQANRIPTFDLIHLGMGADGHTASLFPGSPLLDERSRLVAAVEATGNPPVERLTMTLPVLDNARTTLFLVAGADKQQVLKNVLGPDEGGGSSLPAGLVRPRGKLVWMIEDDET